MHALLAIVPTILAKDSGSINGSVLLGIALIMVMVALMTIATQRRRKTRTPDIKDYARDHASRLHQQQGVREDMEQLFVQLSELARQLNGQMDTRFATLEQVIAHADEKIATLEALLRQAAGVKAIDVVVQDDAPPQQERRPPAPPSPTATQAPPTDPSELRYGRIYTLADQGLPAVEISRQTGQTTGEIELILNLRKSRTR